jgi:thiosulfate/3-mercaptopyruvate sulfurtransferase
LPNRPGNTLTSHPRPELIADRDEVFAAIEDEEVVLVDVLPEEHYSGEIAFYARPGHIPGAINISVQSLTDEEGRYRPFEELVGLHRGDRTVRHITYCGGGIAASSSAFIMTRLGFEDVAVYTASLQEWATDTENPMEVGTR